tara:strand:- start:1631 stop:2290 length:660 start_codon:yes stop_codon:yes gene_type:complete
MSEQNSNRGIRQTLLGIFAFIFLVMLAFVNKINTQHILSPQELMDNGAVLLETPRKFSGLELTDHQGRQFTSTNLQGKWTLFFFGFTSCPDICPTTMSTAANLYESLSSEDQKLLQFTMISLDPERDTTEKLAQYVPYFNKDFIGVTGNEYVLMSLGVQLNIPYSKVSLGESDYTIDHSGNVVIINPYGHYHGFFRPPLDPERMKISLESIMSAFEKQK